MARINTLLGSHGRHRLSLRDLTPRELYASRAEHEGRVPQPGVPPGPRNSSTASASAGYHSDLSIPGYEPQTPTVAPGPGEAAQGPAGHYAGAGRAYTRSLAALPAPIAALSPPLAGAGASAGARPSLLSTLSPTLAALLAPLQPATVGLALGALTEPAKATDRDPAKAILASNGASVDPTDPLGKKTLGNATAEQLLEAVQNGTLKIGAGGRLTTPEVRQATHRLSQLQEQRAQIAGPLPGLDPEQTRVARKVLSTGRLGDATDKELLAAAETGLVESNFRNLQYGDADSQGWRQERTSIYGDGPTGPNNVRAGAKRFFEESVSDTGGTRGAGQTAGELAQTIQGSAFPERYDEVKGQAWPIVKAFEQGGKPSPALQMKLDAATQRAKELGLPTKPATPGQQHVNYLKVFGHQVARQLHYVKSGQLDKGPGTIVRQMTSTGSPADISYGHEPEIAARLKMLAAQRGEPIYIISGHRTPQHSVEVGGFADDPHTEGAAADIGVGEPTLASAGKISEAEYESVGLHRPYASSPAEINHVELLNGGTPATGGGSGGAPAVGGASPAVGGAGGAIAAGTGVTGRPSAISTPIALTNPLAAGPVTPQDVALAGDEHVESAAENLITLLGEGGLSGRRPTL